jgi:hypothetical protein
MVRMECDYVTPSFFRELEKEYQSGLRSEGEGLEGASEPEGDRMAQLARGALALPRLGSASVCSFTWESLWQQAEAVE